MKKLALGALFAGLMACGGGNGTPMLIDMAVDTGSSVCNPVSQTGCGANEKCAWITDQLVPTDVGHIGCAPLTGSEVAIGARCSDAGDKGKCSVTTATACTIDTDCPGETCVGAGPPPGALGFDNCGKGATCIARVCEVVCDPQQVGAASGCDTNHSCGRYTGLFDMGGTLVAGACDPNCDLFTQDLFDGTPACGSVDATKPNLGCFANAFFLTGSCAPLRSDTSVVTNPADQQNLDNIKHLDRTDRVKPLINTVTGTTFKNSCAPGYLPLYFESDTSMKALCTGICAPLAGGLNSGVNTLGANADKEFGDPTVSVKLPRSAAKAVGDGLCKPQKKGNSVGEAENCVYAWGLFLNMDGTIDPMDTKGEVYGFCFPHSTFHYDSDGNGSQDKVFPNFKDLPVRTALTSGVFPATADDACDFAATRNTTCTKAQAAVAFTGQPIVPVKQMFRLGVDADQTILRR